MRISDWSSDVCSSDLVRRNLPGLARLVAGSADAFPRRDAGRLERNHRRQAAHRDAAIAHPPPFGRGARLVAHPAVPGLDPRKGEARERLGHADELLGARVRIGPVADPAFDPLKDRRSEEHTSELQSLMRTSYAVFCLKKKKN